uniref:Uncharacterized protein n=1 Tax=Rhizophora mucronata TaxID=61149 RepID=A0A2P2P4U6_RHIMU
MICVATLFFSLNLLIEDGKIECGKELQLTDLFLL